MTSKNVYSVYTEDKADAYKKSGQRYLNNNQQITLLCTNTNIPIQIDSKPFNSNSFQDIGTTEFNPNDYIQNSKKIEIRFEAILDVKNNEIHNAELILFNVTKNKQIENSLLISNVRGPVLKSVLLKVPDDLPNESQIYTIRMRVNGPGVTARCKMARFRIAWV